MSYQSRILTAMLRTALVLLVWCLFDANGLAAARIGRQLASADLSKGSHKVNVRMSFDQQVTSAMPLKQQIKTCGVEDADKAYAVEALRGGFRGPGEIDRRDR